MRPSILFPLFASISSLTGVGEKSAKLLKKLNIEKVADTLWHLPSGIIDRSYNGLQNGRICTLKVKITEHIVPKNKKQPYKVICSNGDEEITLIFFTVYAQSIAKNLPIGAEKYISGKIEVFNSRPSSKLEFSAQMKREPERKTGVYTSVHEDLSTGSDRTVEQKKQFQTRSGVFQMPHPDFITNTKDEIPVVEAVYPLTAGLSNKFMNKICKQALERVPNFPEWLDENHKKKMNFPSFNSALLKAHNPTTEDDLGNNLRLSYDELLANQLSLAIVRNRIKKQAGRSSKGNGLLRKKILDILPFKLTEAQEKVLSEIFADQAAEFRMHRLLQGDVGSGKTIVSFLAMLNAVECGGQAAIMGPTEILVKQHLETLAPLCEEIGVKIELLTGKVKGKKRTQILQDLQDGKINILVGTHALFVDDVEFKDLSFVVIDEQHRFGVHQRLSLSQKGDKTDILVMTATPIPRTLVLTTYGDMEYSKIDQLPKGRKPTDTRVMPITKADDIILALQKQIAENKRAYWVCPLIDESEKSDLQAAVNRFEILQKHFGKDVGLVHGKMKEKEKDEVMERFKSGKIKVLVSTTVIEVGVNVPEATIMIIEHAERFGLAQLHQLRGRIKRSSEASSCILLYSYPLGETSRSRLNTIRETEDGFLIAEEDLKLRGGGELLGTRQSGFAEFKIADMSKHQDLLLTANRDAKMILEMDANLKTPRGEALRTLLYLFERDEAVRTYLAG